MTANDFTHPKLTNIYGVTNSIKEVGKLKSKKCTKKFGQVMGIKSGHLERDGRFTLLLNLPYFRDNRENITAEIGYYITESDNRSIDNIMNKETAPRRS